MKQEDNVKKQIQVQVHVGNIIGMEMVDNLKEVRLMAVAAMLANPASETFIIDGENPIKVIPVMFDKPKQAAGLEMAAVNNALAKARKQGLEVEVVAFAMKAMKEDGSIDVPQALAIGLAEWDI